MSINKNSVGISDLPFEVIAHVLDSLSHSDLKDARLVCKKWYRASLSTKLAQSEVMCLQYQNVDLTSLLNCERKINHLRIKFKIKIWSNKEFWTKFGPGLHSLTAHSCDISEEHFYFALSFCSGLKVLKLQNAYPLRRFVPLILPDFQLTELCNLVLINVDFDDALCDAIVKRAPNLRVLTVETTLRATDPRCRGEPPFVRFVKYMKDNPSLRFDLRLSENIPRGQDHDYSAEIALLTTIVQLPNVRVVKFDFYKEIMDEWDLLTLNGHSDIKEIYLSPNNIIVDTHIKNFSEKFPNLEAFTAKCHWIRNSVHSSLSTLKLLQNLTSLDLFLPKELTDADVLSGLCSQENRKLKKLRLENYYLSENCFVVIMKCNPALKDLYLHSKDECNTISDWSVQAIFKYQNQLEKLTLVDLAVTDAGLSGEILEDDATKSRQLNPTGHSISRLKRLRELAVLHCHRIVGSTIVNDFKFPEIRAVRLWDLGQLSNQAALRSLIENNRTIELLVLKQRCYVGLRCEDLLSLIIDNLWRLKKLYIKGIHGIPKHWNLVLEHHFGTRLRILRLEEFVSCNCCKEQFLLMYNSDDDMKDASDVSPGPLSPPCGIDDLSSEPIDAVSFTDSECSSDED